MVESDPLKLDYYTIRLSSKHMMGMYLDLLDSNGNTILNIQETGTGLSTLIIKDNNGKQIGKIQPHGLLSVDYYGLFDGDGKLVGKISNPIQSFKDPKREFEMNDTNGNLIARASGVVGDVGVGARFTPERMRFNLTITNPKGSAVAEVKRELLIEKDSIAQKLVGGTPTALLTVDIKDDKFSRFLILGFAVFLYKGVITTGGSGGRGGGPIHR